MDLELSECNVIITGGNEGIGKACAGAFLAEGAKVAIVGRSHESIQKASAELSSTKNTVVGLSADLSDESSAADVVKRAEAALGPVDILVNCAGSARRTEPEELDAAAWREGMESKFMPYINMCMAVLRRFRLRHVENPAQPVRGAIINVIGKGGKVPSETHLPGGAANAALTLATAGLAQIYGSMGVRINAVHPAAVVTRRLRRRYELVAKNGEYSVDELMRRGAASIPLGRYTEPDEVAELVLFLASARASYLAGSNIYIDGAQRPVI